jgi:hypothetical protein
VFLLFVGRLFVVAIVALFGMTFIVAVDKVEVFAATVDVLEVLGWLCPRLCRGGCRFCWDNECFMLFMTLVVLLVRIAVAWFWKSLPMPLTARG